MKLQLQWHWVMHATLCKFNVQTLDQVAKQQVNSFNLAAAICSCSDRIDHSAQRPWHTIYTWFFVLIIKHSKWLMGKCSLIEQYVLACNVHSCHSSRNIRSVSGTVDFITLHSCWTLTETGACSVGGTSIVKDKTEQLEMSKLLVQYGRTHVVPSHRVCPRHMIH